MFFENNMNINEQLQPVVQSLLDSLSVSIEQEVREKITNQITARLADTEIGVIVNDLVAKHLDNKIKQLDFEKVTKAELDKLVYQITTTVNNNLSISANENIAKEINQKLDQSMQNSVDGHAKIQAAIEEKLKGIDARVRVLEVWRWLVIGGALAIGYLVNKLYK